ncbi:MAG: 3-oxoacyl-[acyl-carrier-protein] synthase III C-terminal domain-containing protein [Pirellulaceae bacterium]|jgi:3-oxoacyl-[acyl-carrier-protein] synthase III
MLKKCYINQIGKYLPGNPISNEEMEEYLGMVGGVPSRLRPKVLNQNKIEQRFYALDKQQRTTISNAAMAAHSVRDAISRSEITLDDLELLVTATSQGDLPLPGFASMVHGELKNKPCEIASLHGICASSVLALRHAVSAFKAGEVSTAAVVASELASRLLKAPRFEEQGFGKDRRLPFETEFLRWMLSDGAGALLLSDEPASSGLSLEVESMHIKSYANQFAPCMYVGKKDNVSLEDVYGWLDYPGYMEAASDGAINLHQSVNMLDDVIRVCINGVFELVEDGKLNPEQIDWWVTHYSSHIFREQAYDLLVRGGITIEPEKIFSNLYSRGNMGSASFYLMLEEMLNEGHLEPGQRLFCIVPESGRFLFGYVILKVVGSKDGPEDKLPVSLPATDEIVAPDIKTSGTEIEERLVRQLSGVWSDFENRLNVVPIIQKMNEQRLTVEDYRGLLYNLRQQVIDGSRWISRAASNVTRKHFEIRSAFIGHSSDEHRDFEMLESDYVSVGGELESIQNGSKNIGSEALSEYILGQASRENPFNLIGAMFIIEGLGRRVARRWGERIKEQLELEESQIKFLLYHSESDDVHFERLDKAVQSGILTEELVADIVKTAKVVARLYVLQLEEIGNF